MSIILTIICLALVVVFIITTIHIVMLNAQHQFYNHRGRWYDATLKTRKLAGIEAEIKRYKRHIIAIIITVIWFMLVCCFLIPASAEPPPDHHYAPAIITEYIQDKNPAQDELTSEVIATEIVIQCEFTDTPWEIITAIMCVESRYNPYAVGPMKERGLMQIYTLECGGEKIDYARLFEIAYNIMCGICLYKEKVYIASGNIEKAIELYNGSGPKARMFAKRVKSVLVEIAQYERAYKKSNYKLVDEVVFGGVY